MHSSMKLGQVVSCIKRFPMFRLSFIEKFHCTMNVTECIPYVHIWCSLGTHE